MIEIKYMMERDSSNNNYNIVDEIKSLQTPDSFVFFKSTKGKDKDKKKKKKKIFTDIFSSGGPNDEFSLEPELNRLDDNIDEYDEDGDINDSIISKQKKGYNKLKKDDTNNYKKEFAEELTLLYTLLSESNTFSKKLEKKYEGLDGLKARTSSKYISDLINSIIMTKNSRLSILKEISNIKKTIVDLKIKDNRTKDDKASSVDQLASSYLRNIINYGRQNFVKGATFEEFDEFSPQLENTMEDPDFNEYEYNKVNRMIDQRLEDADDHYRTADSNKIIEYEKIGAKILVQRSVDTGEWDFIAMDKHSQILNDYPLPNKKNITKMSFSDDGKYATDQFGRGYKVTESYDFHE